MIVKFKKLNPKAITPSYSKIGDAGLDLTACSFNLNADTDRYLEYGTGIALEIPTGHVGLLFPRSSITNKSIMLKNSVAVIDSNFRGEIKLRFAKSNINPLLGGDQFYSIGDRIGQLIIVPIPTIELVESEELSDTNRNEGSFGSTGK